MASIDQLRGNQQPLTTTRNSGNQNKTQEAQGSAVREQQRTTSQDDAVSLSHQSREIGKMNQQMASEPYFDSAKVAEIKQAIANGSYKVDADKLAANMMRFENDLNDS
ncbi:MULTISPECIES: flagellar biosynthesis anti-sigma factor FlgM [Salinivibrio]|jgi:negative regulator of flagellin synthesis FlgM|uniref:Negative regulator of flagellin synthesis n=2 Tax=Salinivibrio TaxID=51366 RepID=A0ABY7LAE6_9GAMM|nr:MULTISPECIES: flagellar biosynthesis anti-sigma factor FlgM [Salinivibrio]ODP99729.1 flagellar biosynthesis anti-sigma factor FlgM [Salinivibrio sp. DV]OOF09022.1 flagellar biosynthesis anti-sigma factor FlgM [Salinivibrio sp. PR5]OOF17148.1 flagellar biosynthesis anti-sigma factor FlgM [Salinivibrio sp. PR932]OOF23918.1 flagellar biosynthesis anti-sigma factor FlgM [Salinivibrio sp. IB574]OOF28014.1 flagellar biosynthesis anti-sigma factor FlgM [Salinivibrio proteolyticus]